MGALGRMREPGKDMANLQNRWIAMGYVRILGVMIEEF
jgi:hypothetical protein